MIQPTQRRMLNKMFVFYILFFLGIIGTIISCQSVPKQNNKETQKTVSTNITQQEQTSETSIKKIQPSIVIDDEDNDPEAYTPEFFDQNDYDDENTFSDAQNLNADENLLDEDEEIITPLCEDSVYYQAWKEQFDKNWLMENEKYYKSAKQRNQELDKARADAYTLFAYPNIQKTTYDFPAVINLQVASWINYFTSKGRKNFVVWLSRGQELIPQLEEILDKNGLPKDLVYLAMIESGFNNRAVSVDGATGTWQFMPYTGRHYGLTINDWIDERRDPIKSTQAAARYLTDLYTKFGSWHLAAGAYNCGEGCIAKKLRQYGEDSSYFDLTEQGVINSQTANYVPKILAAMMISKNPENFGFETAKHQHNVITTEKLLINRSIALTDLAANIGIDPKVLADLNPALRLGITPPAYTLKKSPFEIQIPSVKYNLAKNIIHSLPEASQRRIVQARIVRRESLQKFASRYHLNVAQLQKSNKGLRRTTTLKRGQYVNVPITLGTGQYEKLFAVNKHKVKNKKRLARMKTGKHHKIAKAKKKTVKKVAVAKNNPKKKPVTKQEAKK